MFLSVLSHFYVVAFLDSILARQVWWKEQGLQGVGEQPEWLLYSSGATESTKCSFPSIVNRTNCQLSFRTVHWVRRSSLCSLSLPWSKRTRNLQHYIVERPFLRIRFQTTKRLMWTCMWSETSSSISLEVNWIPVQLTIHSVSMTFRPNQRLHDIPYFQEHPWWQWMHPPPNQRVPWMNY